MNTVAIIITYQPCLEVLDKLLTAIHAQVNAVIIIDNHSSNDIDNWLLKKQLHNVFLQRLDENKGIAVAHNLGIQWAKKHKAEAVLLMDQDSIPADDMVAQLINVIQKKTADNINIAAVGPRYFDPRKNNPPPFISIEGLSLNRHTCPMTDAVISVDSVISSGCLIPISVLDKVGLMREDLFIDYVDIEWGLRAQHYGFQSYGSCAAHMNHSLGDTPINFLGKNIPVHSPLRHYYHIRNAVALYKESWIPLNWKLVDGWRLLLKFVFYSLMTKPRLSHFFMMSKGIYHALTNNMGRMGS